jgi:sucrose-6F-phosphate phosphohydrolase
MHCTANRDLTMSGQRLLLCTDLDRTLLPNGTQPESPHARERFGRLAARPEVTLVYVTGRHKALVQKAIKCYVLPQPDFVISDVGTKIYDLRGGHWDVWPDWEREIEPDWAGYSHDDLCDLFRDMKSLRLQEAEKQNTHKLSYYVPLHTDQESLIGEMTQRLESHEIRASLVWSIDEPAGIGLMDVLPRNATKLHAIQFLRQRLGFELAETVFSGDSGNDLTVLTSPLPAVLVANAADSVRETARQEAQHADTGDALYFARGDFLDMNGNYSAGILEGVAHFHPQLREWIEQEGDGNHA